MSFHVPGKILEDYDIPNTRTGLAQSTRMALVDFAGARKPIILDLVPSAKPGDYVRAHAGFATEVVSPAVALRELEQFAAHRRKTVAIDLEMEEALPETSPQKQR